VDLVGGSEVSRLTEKVDEEFARRKIISEGFRERYLVPLGFSQALKYKKATGRFPKPLSNPEIFAALEFAASAVEISQQLSPEGRTRLSGMIRDNLSVSGDARRLQHEFTVAAHFARKGWRVEFADLEGRGKFDYIVSRDGLDIDVECKTISGDKGSPIHRIDALNFMENVHECLLDAFTDGCCSVNVVFKNALPKSLQDHRAIANAISAAVTAGKSELQFESGRAQFKLVDIPAVQSDQQLRPFITDRINELQNQFNGHVGSLFNRRRALILGMSSERQSRILDYTYPEIKNGCEQLSAKRAGCVWTHFVDLPDTDLRLLLSERQPSPLDLLSQRIFANETRRHVCVLSYSGAPELSLIEAGDGKRAYGKRGALPTHRSNVTMFPLPPEIVFP